jgi:hypothetical protein
MVRPDYCCDTSSSRSIVTGSNALVLSALHLDFLLAPAFSYSAPGSTYCHSSWYSVYQWIFPTSTGSSSLPCMARYQARRPATKRYWKARTPGTRLHSWVTDTPASLLMLLPCTTCVAGLRTPMYRLPDVFLCIIRYWQVVPSTDTGSDALYSMRQLVPRGRVV